MQNGLPTTDEVHAELGDNPHPEAIREHAEFFLGATPPVILDSSELYPHYVTLNSYEDLLNFYDEMESPRSSGYVPRRVVECSSRLPTLRTTSYMLTPFEADRLSLDQRVHSVEPEPSVLGHKIRPLGYDYSNGWDKSGTTTNNMKNWGLLRVTNGTQIANWGSDGTPNQVGAVVTTSSGANVDCLVFDGNLLAGHPEYAVNPDGTGGTRCAQYNWWGLNQRVLGQPNGTYDYSLGTQGNNGHGMHVAGIMAGNTQGWAQNGRIFNISPYGEQNNQGVAPTAELGAPDLTQLIAYIRCWNKEEKPINPATGRKNPTIVNMSFGSFGSYFPYNSGTTYVNQLFYRGNTLAYPSTTPAGQNTYQQTYNGNWTVQNFLDYGVQLYQPYIDLYGVIYYWYQNQIASTDQAIIDGMDEGIVWVAALGNQWDQGHQISTDPDYNNYLNLYTRQVFKYQIFEAKYFNRAATPAHAFSGTPGTANYKTLVAVGNIGDTVDQSISLTSSSGSKCTIWAPGTNIMSAYNAAGVTDPRNSAYYLNKLTGTSMASPQVAGVLACLAEQYPNLTQAQSLTYLAAWQQSNVIPDPNIPLPPTNAYYNLRRAPNEYVTYHYDRPISGNTWPQERFWLRPTSGAVYPRPTIQRYPTGGAN